ncbi:Putative F-box/LRR-repeat protein [Apostasia shenzhenica]|uniref:F-box/LRR-repeat protein n=1 Tax=Apostasia shenzhenica TaxID=1088818 RepID=A0A2I0ANR2_9ASPA|nr:Putative F-box/LRR-repeat protein [Apostasia shenzhenica]
MSENAKRQKASRVDEGGEAAVDRISDLPDSLLLHILSFLEAHELVKTSLLSKRWKSLWASATTLSFDSGLKRWKKPLYFVTFVNSFLMLHEGQKIRRFHARLDSKNVQHVYIDCWFHFLKRRAVEEIDLHFSDSWSLPRRSIERERYVICNSLFDCKVLKALTLTGCILDPAACFCFMFLENLELNDVLIPKLDLSCCPLLKCLNMMHCNQYDTLDIHAPNLKFRSFMLTDSFRARDTKLVLYAPNISFIKLLGSLRQQYDVRDLSSLKKASFFVDTSRDINRFFGIFKTFGHAQTFALSNSCLEGLANAVMKNLDTPSLTIEALEVDSDLSKFGIWIIAHALKSFPHVDSLIFKVCMKWDYCAEPLFEDFVKRKLTWKSLEEPFVSVATHIKNITIIDFLLANARKNNEKYEYGEPMSDKMEFSRLVKNENLEPVKLFLKFCTMLKKMDIKIAYIEYIHESPLKSDFFSSLSKRVQNLPRSSKHAQISVS